MSPIVVIGSGILGAALACRLSRAGAPVTVLDAAPPGGAATRASFGWINASFYLNPDHFALRQDGIAAWHRLETDLGALPIRWQGSLWWEEQGAAFDTMRDALQRFGYPVLEQDTAGFATRAPAIATPPERALFLPSEGAAESADLARVLLDRAVDHGAQVFAGVRVSGIERRGGRVCGLWTNQGLIPADRVVVAAGIGSAAVLETVGVSLPMLTRPGVTVTTQAVPPLLSHILVAPGQELRQLPDGRLLAPSSANHQADERSEITEPLADLAGQTLARLRALLPDVPLRVQSTALTMRPVPGDGLPVIGPAGAEGLYTCVMHSGVTLAARAAELAAAEVLEQRTEPALAPYRPDRFWT